MSIDWDWRTALADFFRHGNGLTSPKPLTDADLAQAYRSDPSISDRLPWIDLIGDNQQTILLDDARSVGAVFRLDPIACEGRSIDFLRHTRDALTQFIRDSCDILPAGKSPWVVALYAKNDPVPFRSLPDTLKDYARAQQGDALHPFTHHYIEDIFTPHIEDMAQAEGLFVDELTDEVWGGQHRDIHLVVFRRVSGRERSTPEDALAIVCQRITRNLRAANLSAQRLDGQAIRRWLACWLNPSPKSTGGDQKRFCEQLPPFNDEDRPADWCLTDDVMSRQVRSDHEQGIWWFDEQAHTLLSIERLRAAPDIGQLTAERTLGGESNAARTRTLCLLDQLPAGATLILTFTPTDQSRVQRHLDRIDQSAGAETAEAEKARETSTHARREILDGNHLVSYTLAVALRSDDETTLARQIIDVDTLLTANNLQILDPDYDHYRLDAYLRHLPLCYDPRLDQVQSRTRWIFTQHLANLLPVYGRGTGTGRPGMAFFNRGGEPFLLDPLSLKDRAKNAHLFLFGPTGAGKSASLVYLMMHYLAIYRPRIIICEAGNSFSLMMNYLQAHGFSVTDIMLKPGCGASIPIYRDAMHLLDDTGNLIETFNSAEDNVGGITQSQRDYLGEMLLKTRLMITGGRSREEECFSRADESQVRTAIVRATQQVFKHHQGRSVPVTIGDVRDTLSTMASEHSGQNADRLHEMALALDLFTQGFEGEIFNRTQSSWDDASDVIRIDMGALVAPNYGDRLALAYIGIINEAMAAAEANQHDGRPTIMLTDEGHVITTNPLTAQYKVLISKLSGRRMGFWLWDATQNMADYPAEAEKMLSMFEWWLCLFVGKKELADLERFRSLTDNERQMVLSARKSSGKYTEGCLLSDNVVGLFRNVPPALCLALAQTEKEEKTARAKIMATHQCSELDAALRIAQQIAEARRTP